jgi:hypothetical protein
MGLFAHTENGAAYFFVADAAWLGRSITQNIPPHRIADMLFSDPPSYRATLTNLHSFQLNSPQVQIIPSHCETTLKKYGSKLEPEFLAGE